jgi:diguanylate cyclase (GGDEF)-like protein
MVLPPTRTDGGCPKGSSRCDHPEVRPRLGGPAEAPVGDGSSPAVPTTSATAASGGGSIFRRFVGGERAALNQAPTDPGDHLSVGPGRGPGQRAEAELAERLDTVLGIAGRLAASHDRDTLIRMIVDETTRGLRADAATIRMLRDDRLEVTAWAGLPDDVASRLPVLRRDEGWVGEVLRTGHVLAFPDIRTDGQYGHERYDGILEIAGHLTAPLIHHGRVIGALSALSREPRPWTSGDVAFISTLATHAAIALANAELFEQTVARAAQLEVLQAASARMSRAGTIEEIARTVVEETHGIIDYHNARVYVVEGPNVVPVAFEGRLGAYEHVDMAVLACRLGEGFTGWVAQHGEPILLNDANQDPRGATIAGTEDIDESMLVVPMRYDGGTIGVITLSKLGLDGFGSDDLRLLTILADHTATAIGSVRLLTRTQGLAGELRRLLDMSGELSGSLDPRQVADVMAGHLARAMGVGECIISYWDRDAARVESLGYYPTHRMQDIEPSYEVGGFPETLRVLERQVAVIVDVDDPVSDHAEVELMRRDGNRVLAMLPLVVKGQSIGLVELISKVPVRFGDERLALARTMANEAAMALENARLYEDARNLADRDPVTGFYNHRFLHERLGEEVIRAQRGSRPLSVLMLDLDDFKLVNDTFGHLFGDRVLTWTAELIRSTLRGSDVPARYGGDEFAIVLPDTDGDDARRAADRILEAFRDNAYVGEQRGPVPIGASIGVATFPADGRNATDLIAAADKALYRVKRDGGHDAAAAGDSAA